MKKLGRLSFILSILLIVAASCDQTAAELQKLEKEVMAIHDEAMPGWATIQEKKRALTKLTEKLVSERLDGYSEILKEINTLQNRLTEGDDLMRAWMQNYEPTYEDGKEEARLSYLLEEKIKITKCAQAISSSLKDTEIFLSTHAE